MPDEIATDYEMGASRLPPLDVAGYLRAAGLDEDELQAVGTRLEP